MDTAPEHLIAVAHAPHRETLLPKPGSLQHTHPVGWLGAGALVVCAVLLAACSLADRLGQPSGGAPASGAAVESTPAAGWYAVYFTDPASPKAKALRGGPDAELAQAIAAARLSVDVAVQELDLWSVRDAMLEAYRRGVSVRLVSESDYLENPEVQQLIEAGIPVVSDGDEGRMHNKFVIIDRLEVWSGSMNFTVSEGYYNNNNLIRIRSSELAEDYTVEFEEMFRDGQFGPGSPANTPLATFSVEAGTPLEVYFSPDDQTADRLVELIQQAQQSIRFLVFSFTSDDIAAAMIERSRAGVSVSGVMDERQYKSNIGTEYDRLRSAGINVRLDGNPGNMHHKVILLDERIVITGSYNLSANAETLNDENTLVIHDPQIAGLYLEEFQRIFASAK